MNVHIEQPAGVAADAELWNEFATAQDGPAFLTAWLRLLMRQAGGPVLGVLMVRQPDASFAPAVIWREGGSAEAADASELGPACQAAIRQNRNVVLPAGEGAHVAAPIQGGEAGAAQAILALAFARHPGSRLPEVFRAIIWASGWLEAAWLRNREGDAGERADRAGAVLAMLAAMLEQPEFDAALMAFCNEAADRFRADRVSLGVVRRGGASRLVAMSNMAAIKRRTALAAAIETAQAEAAGQLAPVMVPPAAGERAAIDVAHRRLLETFGAGAALSLNLVHDGRTVAVLTIERAAASPGAAATRPEARTEAGFDLPERDSLRLAAALAGPVIGDRIRAERWVSGRARRIGGQALRKVFGRRHPTAKLAAACLAATVALLSIAETDVRVTARAALEGEVQRAVTAPFAGFVAEAPVRAGERVEAGRLLARFDDRDLQLEKLKWETERAKAEQRQREAMARGERAGMLLAGAQAAQAEAELALALEKLARTRLVAPVAGLVVSGDLSQMLGAPLEIGKVLFEIAPLDAIRVVLQVPETDYRLVAGRHAAGVETAGWLALTGEGGRSRAIKVTLVTPVAEAREGRNGFRVEAALDGPGSDGLRPGMEGVAKLEVGRAPLLAAWSRTTMDRLALLVWSWTP